MELRGHLKRVFVQHGEPLRAEVEFLEAEEPVEGARVEAAEAVPLQSQDDHILQTWQQNESSRVANLLLSLSAMI